MSTGYIGWVATGCGRYYLVDREGVKYASAWDMEGMGQEVGTLHAGPGGEPITVTYDHLPGFLTLDFAGMLKDVAAKAGSPLGPTVPDSLREPLAYASRAVATEYDGTLPPGSIDTEGRYDWEYVRTH